MYDVLIVQYKIKIITIDISFVATNFAIENWGWVFMLNLFWYENIYKSQ